jgi:hypothetical protein
MVKIRFHSEEGTYLGCASYDPETTVIYDIGSIKLPDLAWNHLEKLIHEGLTEGEIENILWEIE